MEIEFIALWTLSLAGANIAQWWALNSSAAMPLALLWSHQRKHLCSQLNTKSKHQRQTRSVQQYVDGDDASENGMESSEICYTLVLIFRFVPEVLRKVFRTNSFNAERLLVVGIPKSLRKRQISS